MPKEDWGFLNEKAFEAALQASVPERLPDKVAAAVTPWKRAMGRVLAGTALTALGTNLWGLNYLLPGIGLVLMLLGFRLLWREEIEACRGAIQVVVSVQEFDQEGGFCRSSGSNPLCITGVGGEADGRACRLDDLPPLSLEHGPALPWDSRHTALAGIPVG